MSFLDQFPKNSIKSSHTKNLIFSSQGLNSSLIVVKMSLNKIRPSSLAKGLAIFFIGCYRTIGTSFLGGCCRFEPSCSEYAITCFHQHSFYKALKLTITRLLKCRPFGPVGYDPVPTVNSEFIHGES